MRLLFKVLVLALLCAGVILVAPSRAASDVPGPKLGLQTWTLRHQTFEQVVNFAVANKIRSVQFISQHLNPEAPLEETRRKKALLDQYGIVPYAFGVARTSSDPATNRKLFEFARFIGAKLIVVEPAPADWDSLESLVKEYDIRLAIHNHGVGTTYGDPQVVKQILAKRDPRIGVCLDVGWITQAGFDVAKVFREYQDRVYDIHFKDKKVSVPGDPSAVDTLIGHGSANYPGLFDEIQRSAWSGVMAIETDSEEFATRPQPFVTAAKSFFANSAPASKEAKVGPGGVTCSGNDLTLRAARMSPNGRLERSSGSATAGGRAVCAAVGGCLARCCRGLRATGGDGLRRTRRAARGQGGAGDAAARAGGGSDRVRSG